MPNNDDSGMFKYAANLPNRSVNSQTPVVSSPLRSNLDFFKSGSLNLRNIDIWKAKVISQLLNYHSK